MFARLDENIRIYNDHTDSKHRLANSTGVFQALPGNEHSLEYLILQAKRLMYEQKRLNKAVRGNFYRHASLNIK